MWMVSMSVLYRLMHFDDLRAYVQGVAAHPILGPRYGNQVSDLAAAISRTLGRDCLIAYVFEDSSGTKTRFLGAGLAVFVNESFLQEVKTARRFWVGPELVKRIMRDESPLLSDAEVCEANSTNRLDLLVWHNTVHPGDLRRPEVGPPMMKAFAAGVAGFQIRELFAQADCLEHLHGIRNSGGHYFHCSEGPEGRYGEFPDLNHQNFGVEPRNTGLSRELAATQHSSWVGSLLLCGSPQIGFTRGEQRLLLLAMDGGTDEELRDLLKVSLTAVKKRWRSIYDRVAESLPQVFGDRRVGDVSTHERGKERRRRLLTYLRDHPEELRPVSRRLLRLSAA
jgi:hypothetical protein